MKPQPVTDLDITLPAKVSHLMPPMAECKPTPRWAVDLFDALFFSGGDVAHLRPKADIDKRLAIRHIQVIMRSFEPKHEHKEAACAYLFALWFEEPREERS